MKKIFLLLLISTPLLFSCNSNENKAKLNEELINNYVKAVENLDYDIMNEILDDSYVGVGPSFGDSIGKKDVIENWKYSIDNLYKGIKYNKSRTIGINVPDGDNKGEWVSNWAELTITFKTDETATVYSNTIYKIKNGKIIKSFTFYNEADVLEQLGFVFVATDSQ